MKLIFRILTTLIVFSSCKHDKTTIQVPITANFVKIFYDKTIPISPADGRNDFASSIVALDSQFLILNTASRWFSGDYVDVTHTWYNEQLAEKCNFTENQYRYGETGGLCEKNGNLYCFDINYFTSSIRKIERCKLGSNIITIDEKGSIFWYHIRTLRITQKGKIVFWYTNSLYCIDTLGSILWKIPSSTSNISDYNDICETSTGDFLILSMFNYDFCLTRFDKNGNLVWQKLYGGSWTDMPEKILYFNDQEIYLIGSSASFASNFNNKEYIIHVNSDGKMIKQIAFGDKLHCGIQTGEIYKDKILVSGYYNSDFSHIGQVFVDLLDKDLNILQHEVSPNTPDHMINSCALLNNTFVVCGRKFAMRFEIQN